jgi:hypothetical protein
MPSLAAAKDSGEFGGGDFFGKRPDEEDPPERLGFKPMINRDLGEPSRQFLPAIRCDAIGLAALAARAEWAVEQDAATPTSTTMGTSAASAREPRAGGR